MTTSSDKPPTDEQLAEWETRATDLQAYLYDISGAARKPKLEGLGAGINVLIQEVRRLRDELQYIPDDKNHFGEIVRGHACARSFREMQRAEKAEAERDGLRDELTVALAKATDLMAERDRYRQIVEKIADLGSSALVALNQRVGMS